MLQVVGQRVDVELAEEWGERPRQTRIVVIGASEGFGEQQLRTQFQSCLTPA